MQLRSKFVVLSILSILCTPVLALTSQVQVQQLINVSGLQELVEKIPASTGQSFESMLAQDGLPEPFKGVAIPDLQQAINTAFSTSRFEQQLSHALLNELDDAELAQITQWYESELGQKFKEAELKYTLLNNGNSFDQFQQGLKNSEVDDQRSSIMYALDNTMKVSESAVDMMANINIAFNVSLSSIIPEEQQLDVQEITQRVNSQKASIVEAYRDYSHDLLMYMYQEFSLDELTKMNAVLSTQAGQDFVLATNTGINRGMFGASLELGQSIATMVQRQQSGYGI